MCILRKIIAYNLVLMLLVFWKSTINQSQFLDDIIRQEVTSSCFWLILGCFLYFDQTTEISLIISACMIPERVGESGNPDCWSWGSRGTLAPQTLIYEEPMGAAHRNKKQQLVSAAVTEGYFYTLSPEAVRRNEKDSQTARPQHLLQLLQRNSAPAKLTVTPDSPPKTVTHFQCKLMRQDFWENWWQKCEGCICAKAFFIWMENIWLIFCWNFLKYFKLKYFVYILLFILRLFNNNLPV